MSGALPYCASKPVSRVLSFKTAIYLDVPLPTRSSHLLSTAGSALCTPTVLLRIEFTAMDASTPSGELLPRLSTLAGAYRPRPTVRQRYISVALFLGSPPAGVTRYSYPVEPGLSSPTGLSPRRRGCPACLRVLFYPIYMGKSNLFSLKFSANSSIIF